MIKEIGLGGGVAIVIFLLFLGYNVAPFLLIAGLMGFFYFIVTKKSLGRTSFQPNLSKSISFDSIGGQATAIKELKEGLDFINMADEIAKLGIRPLKGILLTGPPGTGKTLLAKAAANYTNSSFLAASGSEFIEMYAGVGAQRVRQIFQKAKSIAKSEGKSSAIIFIDEIDVLGTKRGSHAGHMEYDQTLNQLLVEMDGLKKEEQTKILLIAATNRPDMLDPALMRPGRFDRAVKVDLPDKDGRLHILKLHVKGKPLSANVNLEKIAQETFGFSGAHLENLLNEAAILAMRQEEKEIDHDHIVEAIDKVIIGEKADRKPSRDELRRIAIHETGHALISEWVKPGSVAHLTITPRGNALGYMRQTPLEDTYLYTLTMLENQIKVCLGGAVAEQLLLGEKSTGSGNDFLQAIELTKKIIYCGLSPLGIVSNHDLEPAKLNEAVNHILSRQETAVANYLSSITGEFKQITEKLLERETITGDILREILKAKEMAG
jgi:ATP-dependent metalloprotease FtsH